MIEFISIKLNCRDKACKGKVSTGVSFGLKLEVPTIGGRLIASCCACGH